MRKEDRAITVELDGYSWNIIFTDREGFENADLPSSCDGITGTKALSASAPCPTSLLPGPRDVFASPTLYPGKL